MTQGFVAPISGPADLSGQVAMVTGAAGSIGKACANVLAHAGADVACIDLVASDEVEKIVRSHGRKAASARCDITSRQAVLDAMSEMAERLGLPSILVVSSGIGSGKRFTEVDEAELERVVAVNLKGVFWITQAVLPLMQRNGYGKIVYMGSLSGITGGQITGPHYAATKGAVHAMAKWVAKEYARYGIYSNVVAPGIVTSPLSETGVWDRGEKVDEGSIPLGRVGLPQDVAEAVLFLASPASNYLTGLVVNISGGAVLY